MQYISPTERHVEPTHLVQELEHTPVGQNLTLKVSGLNPYGKAIEFYAQMSVPKGDNGEERLKNLGLTLLDTGEKIEVDGQETAKILIDNVEIDSPAVKAGLNWDQTILYVALPQKSLPKELMFIPAFMLAFGVAWNQRRRKQN